MIAQPAVRLLLGIDLSMPVGCSHVSAQVQPPSETIQVLGGLSFLVWQYQNYGQ